MGILSNLELNRIWTGSDRRTLSVQDKTIVFSHENRLSFCWKREAGGLSELPVLKFFGLPVVTCAWIEMPDSCLGFSSF
jgi:hypothetical protein